MRIISKTHDYYDSVTATGQIDNLYVYKRQSEVLNLSGKDAEHLISILDSNIDDKRRFSSRLLNDFTHDYRSSFCSGYLIFCGKCYPYLQINSNLFLRDNNAYINEFNKISESSSSSQRIVTFYNYEAAVKQICNIRNNGGLNGHAQKDKVVEYFLQVAKRVLSDREQQFNVDLITELCIKYKVPYFAVRDISKGYLRNDATIEINPNLGALQFQKIHNSFSAYQNIAMFVCGILGGTEKGIIKISDSDLRDSKGFDSKSFKCRENKKTRKKKKNN